MNQPVVIVDCAATYRAGLARAVAEAGFEAVHTENARDWAALPGPRALLWTARTLDDWKTLCGLADLNEELLIVALIVDATPEAYSEALRCGADSAVAWEAEPEMIVKVLVAATEGHALLPVRVAHAMAQQAPVACELERPTPRERQWLRTLATGVTVGQLAKQIGYSERTLYRLLQSLYQRMGVSNRAEAIHQMRTKDASD